ncbi:MAG: sulfotransferase family protein [Pseudomonadales bacterium]
MTGRSPGGRMGRMVTDECSILLEPYQAVYIDIAKVASSSIKATLASLLCLDGAEGNPHEVDFPRPPRADPLGERMYPGFYAFAFVRNPWDRLVSCYRDKILREVAGFTTFSESGVARCLDRFDAFFANMSFSDFVHAVSSISDEDADEHFRSQSDYVTNSYGSVAVDFVGRFEALDDDIARIAREIGLPVGTCLPRLQAAPKVDLASFYTAETRAIVMARYINDVELFEYDFPSG